MSRKAMIFDFIFTSVIRGIFSVMIAFMAVLEDALGLIPIPLGLIFAIIIMGLYVYSFVDEAVLTFKECKKVKL